MKNIELKTLREEDFDNLTELHVKFCMPQGFVKKEEVKQIDEKELNRLSKKHYGKFVNEVNRLSTEGYDVMFFAEYVELYKELKCCGRCKK